MDSPNSFDSVQAAMRHALETALGTKRISFQDDSDRHKGHAGHDGRGESHFRLTVVSPCFEGQNRMTRHRMVYEALDQFLKNRVHALSIKALTPSEDDS